jgi:hypothetical protein
MFFMPRFADLNCLDFPKGKIQVENRDTQIPQENLNYRWPIKNMDDKLK